MVMVGIIGAKNSGKTVLIEKLLRLYAARGLKVATIKHTGHKHTFDTEGKDTYRHRQAGAVMTMAVSQSEIALFADPGESHESIAKQIIAKACDFCIVEGNKRADRPMVLLTKNLADIKKPPRGNIFASYGPEEYLPDVRHFAEDEVEALASFLLETKFSPATDGDDHA